jgi:hypothetical protein
MLLRSMPTACDHTPYETVYMTKLAEVPGLARVNSQITMKTVKQER